MDPTVSIVTPLHNKGPYIEETIHSVLAQTIGNLEVLVVENHSSDCGPEIVAACAERDSRVRLIMAPPAVRGPGAARNCGIVEARGEWILFLDADDLLEPDYLERRLSVLNSYPDAKIIAGPWKIFYPEAPDVFETHFPNGWKPPFGPPPGSIYAYSPWALHAAILRQDALGSPTPWLEELDGLPAEDNAFWFRVLYGQTIYWNECAGALYRKQTENSRDASGSDTGKAFEATCEMLHANRKYLETHEKKVSPHMAAFAVRVLKKQFYQTSQFGIQNKRRVLDEIRKHLSETAICDWRMIALRIYFYSYLSLLRKHTNR
jgi:glycosyltransferase involved in cell wall biosynthesis